MQIMRRKCIAVLALAVISFGATTRAQSNDAAMKAADEFYQAKNWTEAASAYKAITDVDVNNGFAWLRYGGSLMGEAHYNEALAAAAKAQSAGFSQISVDFLYARIYSKMGDTQKSVVHLKAMVDAGFAQTPMLKNAPELENVRAESGFAEILARADRNAHPCDSDAHYREFDFWLGEWDVRPAGSEQLAGQSKIERILGNCVVLENWTGSAGGSGKSFNVYDPTTKRWEQIWVDAFGSLTKYSGGIKDGAMDYFADSMNPQGKPIRLHLQFFKLSDDKVRQFSQVSADGGKTWSVQYDFIYSRKTTAVTGAQ
jgi:tetratricopeptide (TPR) repeat protein